MGHKWMWNPKWSGLPPEELSGRGRSAAEGRAREDWRRVPDQRSRLPATYCRSGLRSSDLTAGIPIPVGAFDAHWDAIGSNMREGDVVNVVGTSTCIIAMAHKAELVPGVCGVVPGSVHPQYTGIEAGLSAMGDIFEAIAQRAGTRVLRLSEGLELTRPGRRDCCD